MNPGSSATHTGTPRADAGLLDEILDRMRRGEPLDAEQLAAAYPDRAAEVRQLLAVVQFVHEAADKADPVAELDARVHLSRERPLLGEFQILREVARGGMGVVYEAVQRPLDRRVAVKVLLPGVSITGDALERFEREARTAGALQHEHIVPVYAVGDAGGVPYYAMQFIDGESLSAFLKRMRAEGFRPDRGYFLRVARWGMTAAEALHHAHRRGVIHRDVKPSNLLLDADDKVWITDFGLARQDSSLTLTLSGDIVGTAMYMSPEQARGGGRRVDERTDVYSLGVTLYELLSLKAPFEGPDRESTLKQVLLDQARPLRRLDRTIPRDLETIVGKAIEKEPERRYAAAAFLAEDLRRFVAGEPILARRASLGEQIIRLVARHRLVAGFLLLLFAVVSGFAVWMSVLYAESNRLRSAADVERDAAKAASLRAAANEEKARQAAEKAQAAAAQANTTLYFLRDMLESVNPEMAQGKDTTLMEQILSSAAQRVRTELASEPEVRAKLNGVIGRTYVGLAKYELARPFLTEALEYYEGARGFDDPDTIGAASDLGWLHDQRGEFSACERYFRRAADAAARVYGPDHLNTMAALNNLAVVLSQQAKFAEAEPIYRRGAAIICRDEGPESEGCIVARSNLAVFLSASGKTVEAEREMRALVELARRQLGPRARPTLMVTDCLAGELTQLGRFAEAEEIARRNGAVFEDVFGPDHPETQITRLTHASALRELGRAEEALAIIDDALRAMRETLPECDTRIRSFEMQRGACLTRLGRREEAETLLLGCFEAFKPPTIEAWRKVSLLKFMVELYEGWSKPDQAARYRSLLDDLRATTQPAPVESP